MSIVPREQNTNQRSAERSIRLVLIAFTPVVLGLLVYAFLRPAESQRETTPASSVLSGRPHELIAKSGLFFLGTSKYSGSASYALETSKGVIVIDPGFDFSELA